MSNLDFIRLLTDQLSDTPPCFNLRPLESLELVKAYRVWPPPVEVPPMDPAVMKRIFATMPKDNDPPTIIGHMTMNPVEELRFFIAGVIEEYESGTSGNIERMYSRARFLEDFFFRETPVADSVPDQLG